jgi:hypothetical protein
MALVLDDRVQETTTTTGTGTVTLAGASLGYQSFAIIGDGNTTYYCITDGTNWETGLGTYTASGTTLARTTVLESSNGGSLVNFSAGTKNVFVTYPASQATLLDATQTLTNKTLTTPNIDSAQFATVSGTAPIYPCRAWVNFNGTGTVAIRASGNVSSITDNGVGSYTVNFTTAMPDSSYSAQLMGNGGGGRDTTYTVGLTGAGAAGTYSASAFIILSWDVGTGAAADSTIMSVSVFR